MSKDRRKQPLWIITAQGKRIGVTDARGSELDQTLTGPGAFDINFVHDQGFARLDGDRSFDLHWGSSRLAVIMNRSGLSQRRSGKDKARQ